MKKLLIIQQDEAYFLFETIQVIEKNPQSFKDFELTLLVSQSSLEKVFDRTIPVLKGLTTDVNSVLNQKFDISVNLSLAESSWDLHGEISSGRKIGMYKDEGQLWVEDLWSSYLLTLKSKTPFLTFHLQDIYKNILGIKSVRLQKLNQFTVKQIAFGMMNPEVFPANEQEKLINELARNYPAVPIKDITEVDLVSDLSDSLYIGPASLSALKFCEAGGKGIFLTSSFSGFNLFPYGERHLLISSRNKQFVSSELKAVISNEILNKSLPATGYSYYRTDLANTFGALLESLNPGDDHYPFYQSYVVLWNFLLNLYDAELSVTHCTATQLELLKTQEEILSKLIRLHDYAMSSIDSIYHESKLQDADHAKIKAHVAKLVEIEEVSEQIAAGHPLLRPLIDFYRIRRGQNQGNTLAEQSQSSFLTYAEEHQALQALHELFSVTLKRNEVNI